MRRTFLQLTHVGRKTGQPHDAVAMVLHDEARREAVICAAWGPNTDWVRNLRTGPAKKCSSARTRSRPITGS
jgi:deazaflavin-dependent oxidoreductase (nitroreductase family)